MSGVSSRMSGVSRVSEVSRTSGVSSRVSGVSGVWCRRDMRGRQQHPGGLTDVLPGAQGVRG